MLFLQHKYILRQEMRNTVLARWPRGYDSRLVRGYERIRVQIPDEPCGNQNLVVKTLDTFSQIF